MHCTEVEWNIEIFINKLIIKIIIHIFSCTLSVYNIFNYVAIKILIVSVVIVCYHSQFFLSGLLIYGHIYYLNS